MSVVKLCMYVGVCRVYRKLKVQTLYEVCKSEAIHFFTLQVLKIETLQLLLSNNIQALKEEGFSNPVANENIKETSHRPSSLSSFTKKVCRFRVHHFTTNLIVPSPQ